MYLDHFGLTEKPFNITPNPQFIFLSKNHKEVFAHLLYGLQSRCGFIEITGEIGAGKTTVLRTLFEQMAEDEFRLAFIFNPSLSAEELLLEVCRELGLSVGTNKGAQLLPIINRFLLDENAAGRTVVLVVDEAQNLAAPVLEQIRLLSNLETETDKLIQIILVGQPELADLLARTNLRQLNQRISIRYHLESMDFSDSAAYIVHRLQIAGLEAGRSVFTPAAIRRIYKFSSGLPRVINILSDRSLLAAYSEDKPVVDHQDVQTAINELRQVSRSGRGSYFGYRFLRAVALTAGVALLGGLVFAFSHYRNNQESLPVVETSLQSAVKRLPAPVIDQAELGRLRDNLADAGELPSFVQAATALAERWHIEFSQKLPGNFGSQEFIAQLDQNGWQWTAFYGDFSTIENLDSPVLLEIVLPGVAGRRYLAVTGVDDQGRFRISPSLGGRHELLRSEMQALYGGRAYFVWKNYLDIGFISAIGTVLADVREIQTLLRQAGESELIVSGIYDQDTVRAVTRFQSARGIVQDGRVGPLTLLLLYQGSGYFNPPRLSGVNAS